MGCSIIFILLIASWILETTFMELVREITTAAGTWMGVSPTLAGVIIILVIVILDGMRYRSS